MERESYLGISRIWLVYKVAISDKVVIDINANVHEVEFGLFGGILIFVYSANQARGLYQHPVLVLFFSWV